MSVGSEGRTKLTVALPDNDLALLNMIATLRQANKTTMLVKAIRLLAYVQRILSNGGRVMVEENGERYELTL